MLSQFSQQEINDQSQLKKIDEVISRQGVGPTGSRLIALDGNIVLFRIGFQAITK